MDTSGNMFVLCTLVSSYTCQHQEPFALQGRQQNLQGAWAQQARGGGALNAASHMVSSSEAALLSHVMCHTPTQMCIHPANLNHTLTKHKFTWPVFGALHW